MSEGTMAQGGFYSAHQAPQHAAASYGLALLRTAAQEVPLGDDDCLLLIADFGAAQGRDAAVPMGVVLEELRQRTESAVLVLHSDLPDNDWTTFFGNVSDHDVARVLDVAVGRSLFGGVLPDATLTVGWCSSTLHWLSTAPCAVRGHVFVQASDDREARSAYRRRSAEDWEAFLTARARELRPGGSVVFVDTFADDDGTTGGEALFDLLQTVIDEAVGDGRLTPEAAIELGYPTWFRNESELRAPFDDRLANSGLRLVDLRTSLLDDPFGADLAETGDVMAYGTRQAGFVRGFLDPSFRSQLVRAGQATDVLDWIWTRFAKEIAADPHAVAPEWRLVTGRIARTRG